MNGPSGRGNRTIAPDAGRASGNGGGPEPNPDTPSVTDLGPRYMLNGFNQIPANAPGYCACTAVRPDDVVYSVAHVTFAGADDQSGLGVWQSVIDHFSEIKQLTSTEYGYGVDSFMGFIRRPHAWKRDYKMFAVQAPDNSANPGPVGVSMPGVRVGWEMGLVGIFDMGTVNYMYDGPGILYPLVPQGVGAYPYWWETVISVDNQIQFLGANVDASDKWYIFFMTTTPLAAPAVTLQRDYFCRVVHGTGIGPVTLTGARAGDRVDNVVSFGWPSMANTESEFEIVISVTGQIQKLGATNDFYLILWSRPTEG